MGQCEDYKFSSIELAEILRKKLKSNKYNVVDYTLEKSSEKIGLLGEHCTLKIQFQANDSSNISEVIFFAKLFPKYKNVATFAEKIGAFEKEIFMYELFDKFCTVNKLIKKCVSNCYLTKFNTYLILDHLKAQEFLCLDKHKLLDLESVKVIVQSLAKFHSATILYEETLSENSSQGYRLINQYHERFDESFFNDKKDFINEIGIKASIKGVLGAINIFDFPETLPSGKNFCAAAENLCFKIYQLVKPSEKYRNVVCHGDLWATNYLLKYDHHGNPIQCKFVDFQCGRYTPPAQDVMSFIYLTTSRDFRKKHLYKVIGEYYAYVEKIIFLQGYKLKDLIPWQEFLDSCEEHKLFAMVQAAIYFPLILIQNDSIEEYFSNETIYKKAMEEDRTFLILANKDRDPLYTRRILESIQDIYECCSQLY